MFAIVSMATSANLLIALCAISAFLEVSTLSNYELCLNVADEAKCEYYMKISKIHDDFMSPDDLKNLQFKEKYNLRRELKDIVEDKWQFKKEWLDKNSKKKNLEHEEKMTKWQKNFNVLPRSKRSANEFEKFISRVKNIIPKYLHKKVKPAVDKKKSTQDSTRIKKHHHAPHKARKSKQRHITTTIRTKNNHPKH